MARILYALSGQGRGHTSRGMAVAETLRARGHTVGFACGPPASGVLAAAGEPVLAVPALHQVVEGNRLRPWATARLNAAAVLAARGCVRRLAEAVRAWRPDLVVTDFEPFVPRAAHQAGVPVVVLDHQHVLTETRLAVAPGERISAAFVRLVVRALVPRRRARTVVSTFFFPPVRRPDRTALVGPILRAAVREAYPTAGAHVLVYLNEGGGTGAFLDGLGAVGVPFVVYGAERTGGAASGAVTFRAPSPERFVADLAGARAVVCTAGFTLLSESLYLGTPVLALPNRGVFEQTLNARMLEASGGGEALYDRLPGPADLAGFLGRAGRYRAPKGVRVAAGNDAAADALEAVVGTAPGASAPARSDRARSAPGASRPVHPAAQPASF